MMKRTLLVTSLLCAATVSGQAVAQTQYSKEEVGQIAAEYLIENPQFLIQANERLQQIQRQQAHANQVEQVIAHQEQLINKQTPYMGNPEASIAVIEFTDYRCGYCQRMAPVIDELLDSHPDIQFRFKETPVLGQASLLPAQLGLAVYDQKGAQAYAEYHHQAYKAKTPQALSDIASQMGVSVTGAAEWNKTLNENTQLFNQLGFRGTPAFIVMPTSGANASNIQIVAGANTEGLQAAIDKIKNTQTNSDTRAKS
ncbi:thioredoxin domain-containing protein [Vibrio coralliilyticus]|uniref:DsbA family protein n=1 Tax=Vibrio coralliilyticus TaxID=190893 RepID=UPI0015609BC4|nr:thioredoxin domain-containing protein [Vibrio coralliilyticus]NRF27994.1 thioredoxin domain-containing protein [Vibrio coralliilyticus]NRF82115.1 thioredoxin domain-containing protein [Vibrio coralliilyticus]